MVVLKKIKSASLIEILVATAIIVIVFVVASLILNNLILNSYSQKTHIIEYRLNELEYDLLHKKIKLPYNENYEKWDVTIQSDNGKNHQINITAINLDTNKTINKTLTYEE